MNSANDGLKIINGIVREIIYYNEQNSYTVCYVETENEYLPVVGFLPLVAEGESITAHGEWVTHSEYGLQFKASYYEKNLPKAENDILKYLSSGIIKGIGKATAKKIVDYFGGKALDIMAKNPEELSKISGISQRKALEIGSEYAKQFGVREIVIFLQKFDISPTYSVKVYQKYGINSVDVVKTNPYVLFDEVNGITFSKADKIASSLGFLKNSVIRIEAGVKHCLIEAIYEGHSFLPVDVLTENVKKLLNISDDEIKNTISAMAFTDKVFKDTIGNTENIYLPQYYNAETYCASKLLELSKKRIKGNVSKINKKITDYEKETNTTLAKTQKEAIISSINNGVTVITGGPGTGKTTIVKAIIDYFKSEDKKVFLAAPTGRAAKRMSEVCDEEAKTIHRLLESEYSEDGDNLHFSKNEEFPLECDALIVDEMSMVDILLMYHLLKAVSLKTKLILVGDSDQLPAVGAGYVLRDIIASNTIDVFTLNEIFRQSEKSTIIVNAHRINNGEYPICNEKGTDFFIVKRENGDDIVNTIIDVLTNRLPKTYYYDPMTDIQILTPTRKGIVGVSSLNNELQKVLNPHSKSKNEKAYLNFTFREGDKVMQNKNNYEIEWKNINNDEVGVGVFNGDVGYITEINNKKESIKVLFDGEKLVKYHFSFADELELAYAMTVHKSQGSEFDVVIMPMYPAAPMLRNRNLFYTAVTRAKKMVILIGRQRCANEMVDGVFEYKRYSNLGEKMKCFFSHTL